jgi:hypothetical protein
MTRIIHPLFDLKGRKKEKFPVFFPVSRENACAARGDH